jgi:hypothetical protein
MTRYALEKTELVWMACMKAVFRGRNMSRQQVYIPAAYDYLSALASIPLCRARSIKSSIFAASTCRFFSS